MKIAINRMLWRTTASIYQSVTFKRKLEIIDEVEQSPRNKKKYIASEFCIPQSTLSTILKDNIKLHAFYTAGKSKQKHCREPTRPEVDVLYCNGLQPQESNLFQSVARF